MDKPTVTYVNGRMDKFVVIYDGLAHWFKMKGQYLFRVSPEEDFHTETEALALDALKFNPIKGSIVTLKKLLEMRLFYGEHPISKSGRPRPGADLLPEYKPTNKTDSPCHSSE